MRGMESRRSLLAACQGAFSVVCGRLDLPCTQEASQAVNMSALWLYR
jgi:hypothetical protein